LAQNLKQASEESYVKTSRQSWVSIILLLAIISEAVAQTNNEPRVERLEEMVRSLERRLSNVEEQLRLRGAVTSIPSDRTNWRKLQKGLSETEVEKLLGSPARVTAFGPFTVWYYGARPGGEVTFDGSSRTVTGWREP
jgi:outer membrane protein assembly factor BamE (lipoprotein component of BamABCDE complex)